MMTTSRRPVTAFRSEEVFAAGPLCEVALAVKAAIGRDAAAAILVFDDANGRVVDLDLRGTEADVLNRLERAEEPETLPHRRKETAGASGDPRPETRGRGRPALGVVAREVTLLPRHWDWLAAQPRSASATLRRLVDDARHAQRGHAQRLQAQEAAYRFMSAMAGNLPGFEEAARALFAADREGFEGQTADWPKDLRSYASRLAFPSFPPADQQG